MDTLLDPRQLTDVSPATRVEHIIAKLFLRAWRGQSEPQPLGRMQMISDPGEVEDVLRRSDKFPKHYSFLTELGRSRLDAEGIDWARRRDLTQPLYREAAKTQNREAIVQSYEKWLTDDAVQSGQIGRALLAAATEVFLHALGGTIDSGPIADWLLSLRQTAILAQHTAMFDPTEQSLRKLQNDVVQLRRDLRTMLSKDTRLQDQMVDRFIDLDHTFDLLGELTINLFAGAETTVSSISWALNVLARKPELQDQIATQFAENGPNSALLAHFIQEVMRYAPPVPVLVRKVGSDGETIAGRPVNRGEMIALSFVGLHHHPDHWADPTSFQASRPEFVENSYHRRAYLPFSAGARVCGGIGLARAEVATALESILRRYQIAPVDAPIRYEYSLTLRPVGTSQLRFTKRA